jgi:uncharacterized protein (DUF3820 family)
MVLRFGKYKGKTLYEISNLDIKYLEWLSINSKNNIIRDLSTNLVANNKFNNRFIIKFGKYKDQTIDNVIIKDYEYIKWLSEKSYDETIKEYCKIVLIKKKHLIEQAKEKNKLSLNDAKLSLDIQLESIAKKRYDEILVINNDFLNMFSIGDVFKYNGLFYRINTIETNKEDSVIFQKYKTVNNKEISRKIKCKYPIITVNTTKVVYDIDIRSFIEPKNKELVNINITDHIEKYFYEKVFVPITNNNLMINFITPNDQVVWFNDKFYPVYVENQAFTISQYIQIGDETLYLNSHTDKILSISDISDIQKFKRKIKIDALLSSNT